MGRSFLSVKLAFAFGICVAILVLVADHVTPGDGRTVPAAAEQPVQFRGQHALDMVDGVEVCLWRGCPTSVHPRVGAKPVAATRASRASRPG